MECYIVKNADNKYLCYAPNGKHYFSHAIHFAYMFATLALAQRYARLYDAEVITVDVCIKEKV